LKIKQVFSVDNKTFWSANLVWYMLPIVVYAVWLIEFRYFSILII